MSLPNTSYIVSFIFPFPKVDKIILPLLISLNETFEFASAILVTTSSIYPASVKSFFRNLYLAGTL